MMLIQQPGRVTLLREVCRPVFNSNIRGLEYRLNPQDAEQEIVPHFSLFSHFHPSAGSPVRSLQAKPVL